MPKQKRKHEIHDLVTEWNEIVDQNERNVLRQEQIIRRLKSLRALPDVQPVPFAVVVREGAPPQKRSELTAKPNGTLS